MLVKISLAVGVIFSFITGITTFCKFYNHINNSELILLIFLRVLITFVLFFALGLGLYFFLKKQVPQIVTKSRAKKPVSTKIDYVLPSISPTTSVEETTMGKLEEKKTLSEELSKADTENLVMMIKTIMAQE